MKRCLKIISLPIAFLLINSGTCLAQEKSPLEVVMLFDKCYGGPLMDEIADYTTPGFRDNKRKSVWIVETWKTLQAIQYERLNSSIMHSEMKDDKAVVIMEAKIKTAASEVSQKEIYYLVREAERWFIDELVVTGEEIDPEKLKL